MTQVLVDQQFVLYVNGVWDTANPKCADEVAELLAIGQVTPETWVARTDGGVIDTGRNVVQACEIGWPADWEAARQARYSFGAPAIPDLAMYTGVAAPGVSGSTVPASTGPSGRINDDVITLESAMKQAPSPAPASSGVGGVVLSQDDLETWTPFLAAMLNNRQVRDYALEKMRIFDPAKPNGPTTEAPTIIVGSMLERIRKIAKELKTDEPIPMSEITADKFLDEMMEFADGAMGQELTRILDAVAAYPADTITPDVMKNKLRRHLLRERLRAIPNLESPDELCDAVARIHQELPQLQVKIDGPEQTRAWIDAAVEKAGKTGVNAGYQTPWALLNGVVGGLLPGTLNVIGGAPGTGKTSITAQVAAHLVETKQCAVVFASYEMPAAYIRARIIAAFSGIQLAWWLVGRPAIFAPDPDIAVKTEMQRRMRAAGDRYIQEFEPFIRIVQCNRDTTAQTLEAEVQKMQRQFGSDRGVVLAVDHLHAMPDTLPNGKSFPSRAEALKHHMDGLRALISNTNCATWVVAQLNRDGRDGAPEMADFMGSADIEYGAGTLIELRPRWKPLDGGRSPEMRYGFKDSRQLTRILRTNKPLPIDLYVLKSRVDIMNVFIAMKFDGSRGSFAEVNEAEELMDDTERAAESQGESEIDDGGPQPPPKPNPDSGDDTFRSVE